MRIDQATADEIPACVACIVAAFDKDPLLSVFFGNSPLGRNAAASRFFSLLLDARLALGMPVLVARGDDKLLGVAMGYDTQRPDWPDDMKARMAEIEAIHPHLSAQFEAYDAVAAAAGLDLPHHYLGVLAVQPEHQGKGIGKALVTAFTTLSDRDPTSHGTSLETAAPANLGLYQHLGFQVRTSGLVDGATLWCLYRPKSVAPFN